MARSSRPDSTGHSSDNRIDGHTDGILIGVLGPADVCRRNEIRENMIRLGRVGFRAPHVFAAISPLADTTDHTIVGVPISLGGQYFLGGQAAAVEDTNRG